MKKTNKYKLNMKNLMVGLGATTAVIAPIATLVACGSSKDDMKKTPNILQPIDNTPKIDTGTGSISQISQKSINALPSILSAYSVDSLREDAIKFGDESMWTRGVAYHTLGTTLSFIKGLAETYGWTREDYSKKHGLSLIDETNDTKTIAEIAPSVTNVNIQNKLEGLRGIIANPAPLTSAEERDIYFEGGDNDGGMGQWDYETFHLSSKYTKTYPSSDTHAFVLKPAVPADGTNPAIPEVKTSVKTSDIFSFADINHPGNMKVAITSNEAKATRVVSVKDAFKSFAVVSQSQLENDIAPYAKALIEKFLDFYKKNAGMVYGHIPDEVIDQISYLIEKNTIQDPNDSTKKIFSIDDATFDANLTKLNNGSTHWLALKTFYLGLDNSFIKNGFESYNKYGDWSNSLKGVKDNLGVGDLMNWAHWNQTKNPKNERVAFVASKTLDENDIFNDYVTTRQKPINDLIASPDGQKYLVSAGVITTGKTIGELHAIIDFAKFKEANATILAKMANIATATETEVRDFVAKTILINANPTLYSDDTKKAAAMALSRADLEKEVADHNKGNMSAIIAQAAIHKTERGWQFKASSVSDSLTKKTVWGDFSMDISGFMIGTKADGFIQGLHTLGLPMVENQYSHAKEYVRVKWIATSFDGVAGHDATIKIKYTDPTTKQDVIIENIVVGTRA